MELYSKKSRWKIYLAIAGVIILLISLIYTQYLVNQLKTVVNNTVETVSSALREQSNDNVNDPCGQCHVDFFSGIISRHKSIPILLAEGDKVQPQGFVNFGTEDTLVLNRELRKMIKKGVEPIRSDYVGVDIYYQNPAILNQLRYFPYIQLSLIAAFIFYGYLSFSNARRAEQNRVWVGMAKETAHQLGTPISGMLAWMEHLRMLKEEDEEVNEVLDELGKDISRLELIADRFSKIGAEPKLVPVNIFDELESSRAYMQRRAPRKVNFNFPDPASNPLTVHINSHLFNWVVENLLRNALDAMGPKGAISAQVQEEKDFICIDISDTGKGIPNSKFKTVFQPGYTTKKRGWGLGLSLAKRIIEEYHSGKIFVKKSEENVGTTFSIKLPKEVKS